MAAQFLSQFTSHVTILSAYNPTSSASVEHLIQMINEDGFFSQKDAAKGLEAEQFVMKKFPITIVDGLEFCKAHTLTR